MAQKRGYNRTDRVSQEILRLLSGLLQKGVKDPRLQFLTLTECKVSKDLSQAKIYFSSYELKANTPEVKEVIEALEKATGYFRSEIAKQLNLRIVPNLRFYFDHIPEQVAHIEELIRKALAPKD